MHSKYWLRIVGTILLVGIGGGIAMSLYMVLINSQTTLEDAVMMLPFEIAMFGMMANLIYGVTLFRTYISVAVGFGCTRKEAWGGLQLVLVLGAVGMLAAAVVAALLIRSELAEIILNFVPAVFAVILTSGALGQIFGMICDRYGKWGVVIGIFTGLFAGVGAAISMTFVLRAAENGIPVLMNSLELKINVIACVAGGLVWLVNLLLQGSLLKRYAVRF